MALIKTRDTEAICDCRKKINYCGKINSFCFRHKYGGRVWEMSGQLSFSIILYECCHLLCMTLLINDKYFNLPTILFQSKLLISLFCNGILVTYSWHSHGILVHTGEFRFFL